MEPELTIGGETRFAADTSPHSAMYYLDNFQAALRNKQGLQSPFVHWRVTKPLLDLALLCIPPVHLRCYFERLLLNIRDNRSGLPDLIQFWPNEQRYRLIEIKGPGDRLEDNQKRWLNYCEENALPITCVRCVGPVLRRDLKNFGIQIRSMGVCPQR